MTQNDLMNDSNPFNNKEGSGYIHAEIKNHEEIKIFLRGHAMAVEVLAYEIIKRIADSKGVPTGLLLTKMLVIDKAMEEGDDLDHDEKLEW